MRNAASPHAHPQPPSACAARPRRPRERRRETSRRDNEPASSSPRSLQRPGTSICGGLPDDRPSAGRPPSTYRARDRHASSRGSGRRALAVGVTLNKSAIGFEDAGETERPASRTKAAKQNRTCPDMETPGAAPRGDDLGRDLGHNAAQIRQRGGFILTWKTRSGPGMPVSLRHERRPGIAATANAGDARSCANRRPPGLQAEAAIVRSRFIPADCPGRKKRWVAIPNPRWRCSDDGMVFCLGRRSARAHAAEMVVGRAMGTGRPSDVIVRFTLSDEEKHLPLDELARRHPIPARNNRRPRQRRVPRGFRAPWISNIPFCGTLPT